VTSKRGPGRRPGGPDTRGEILAAARTEFAARGFDGTTMRAVATNAGVDAALVHHYFGGKDDLFLAALEIPVDPRVVIPEMLRPGSDGIGERLVRMFVSVWDDPESRKPLLAVFRSALTSEAGADLLRGGMMRMVFEQVAEGLGVSEAPLRAQLVGSQMTGLVMMRYILAVEPIASMAPDQLVRWLGPTVQRYLVGLPGLDVSTRRRR
jgi:AcrR family transcriptional regulator